MSTQPEYRSDLGARRELDLSQYLMAVWRRRLLIGGAALLCGLVALAVSLRSPRQYEAEARLLMSRPKLADPADRVAGLVDTPAVANFLPFVASRAVAAQVIKEFNLDQAPHFASPSSFFGTIVTIEEVRGSTIILLTGRLTDAPLVARVVNRVAELGADAARVASQRESVQARDDIKQQLEESSKRLDEAEARLQKFREASQVEVVKQDVEAAMERRRAQIGARKLDAPHLTALNQLYAIEAQLSRLELERDLSRKVYQEVASTYETTRLLVAGRSSGLQILGTATVPDRPVSRNVLRNVVSAIFAGLLVAALGVLLHATTTSSPGRDAPSRTL